MAMYDQTVPTGCIKDDNDLSWEKFNILLEKVYF